MNYNINSSGLYDVNSYNLVSTNATILSSLNVSGLTTLSNDTNILGTLNVSGNALLHNFITMNSPLYINTNQETTISALSVNSTSVSVLVNIVQNAIWNDGVNYALNVSGYSMFGGVQINGQDSNHHIYKRVGDLTIASPSTHSIILKTNSGAWEAMRLNTVGTSINTSLYISGTTRLNNTTTCTSSLNVSGTTTLSNNVTCASSLNVSGTSNIGPLFINNFTGNTFLKIGTTGNILNITSNYSKYGTSEDPEDTNIRMFKNAGIYHSINYNTSGNTFHLFGDSTSNSYLKLEPLLNTSYNPLIVMGNTTMNSNLNILENVYAKNLPNVS